MVKKIIILEFKYILGKYIATDILFKLNNNDCALAVIYMMFILYEVVRCQPDSFYCLVERGTRANSQQNKDMQHSGGGTMQPKGPSNNA